MKKLLSLMIMAFAIVSSVQMTHALSCAGFASFDDMYETHETAFLGTVTDVTFIVDDSEVEYCNDVGLEGIVPGTFTFTFDVDEVYKGSLGSSITLTRMVSGPNCTRGGACSDMEVGMSYTVLTNDGQTLGGGLCNACPYQEGVYDIPDNGNGATCICTMEYDPVCGKDGNTYGNNCEMNCQQVDKAYDGECTDDSVDAIPANCISYYDGCNTCAIEANGTMICTQLACVRQDTPKCLEFSQTYIYLTDAHITIISDALDMYFAQFSGQELEDKKERLLERVEEKIADIQYTLSVSSFVQGSELLRKYQFLLEVLDSIKNASQLM